MRRPGRAANAGVAGLAMLGLALRTGSASGQAVDVDRDHDGDRNRSPEPRPLEVTVHAERPGGEAASRSFAGRRDLEMRPRGRPGDVVESVPGLFAAQHAGGGKAMQTFLRGFDADHGTDVAFFVDGVPVNLPAHGHGQGYADLHFVIPELIVAVEGYKGPYHAHLGDFATAGAVRLRTADVLEEGLVRVSAGGYGVTRALVAASPDVGEGWRTLLGGEAYAADGPFDSPEGLRRWSAIGRIGRDVGEAGELTLTWSSYGARWNASGQIPARAVCGEGERGAPAPAAYGQPCLSRFGSVDPTEGGATQRHALAAALSTGSHEADFAAIAYLVQYRFTLWSNFTFFASDPVNGDQIEQGDARTVLGTDLRWRRHAHAGGARFTTTLGLQARSDTIDGGLWRDVARERMQARQRTSVVEGAIGLWAEEDVRLARWLRYVVGLRADRIDARVDDLGENTSSLGSRTSGTAGAALVSPKMMVVVSPARDVDLFADYGRGFHSNDPRGAVRRAGSGRMLTPATGYEVGTRVEPVRGVELRAAAFLLDLDSELVWVGDEGRTEPAGRTRRYGAEAGANVRMVAWLRAFADATLTRARLRDNPGNGDAVALAPTRTLTAGLGARGRLGPVVPFGSAKVKSLAARPATEDGSLVAEGLTLVDADAGVRWRDLEAAVEVQNVLGARWREVQFATMSRLPWEPAPVRGIHYTPGWPRTAIARLTYYFR